ncbi:hypothetical protein LTS07_005943 [Exophiala sideris]|uniref:Uncharacterized protein n=1 Tax=Exophiala sideris TaxID=1016849 RepID=A0ABR0J786_9EURO|nr:hypothetical protein LTS07_005943 [Exophiala sideris]KAK5036821.1 hypothetical protein LTR13_005201 [Exophiala sideris]KAK5058111.1 hypothetical protein LTR69_007108 [Exophiala sideris]KAK5182070.1 hypothetical protein LTR44_005671 [Eurotiomycetes sp. CCFEE 6388]
MSAKAETSSQSVSTATAIATEQDGTASSVRHTPRRQSRRQDSTSDSSSLPDRKSSLSQNKRPRTSRRSSRKDTASLHRQSCLLFESLDGVLAQHGGFGSEPSMSPPSTRTTTRRASLEPAVEGRNATATEKAGMNLGRPSQMHSHSYTYSSRKTSLSLTSYQDSRYNYTTVTPRVSVSPERIDGLSGDTLDDESIPTRPPLNTVISWTSDATRRTEYEKIDRAHSGVRGFWRSVMPKCFHKEGRRAFFTGESSCDGDSVRRFRLDLDADADSDTDTEDDGNAYEEKIEEMVDPWAQGRNLDGEKGASPTEHKIKTKTEVLGSATDGKKNWWTCFQ